MKKLFILPAILLLVAGLSTTALAYTPYLGNSCYNCHPGSFGGYYNSYSYSSSYSYNSYVRSGWYDVDLKYHFPYRNFYGGYGGYRSPSYGSNYYGGYASNYYGGYGSYYGGHYNSYYGDYGYWS